MSKPLPPGLPAGYEPLSPWAYFGYSLLFSIPVVGFILLIVFSFSGENVNRQNFARSYFCIYALGLILCGIIVAFTIAVGGIASLSELTNYLY